MTSRKIEYGTTATLTAALENIATSATLVAGIESSTVDNSTNKYLDYLVSGKWTAGTSPTASRLVEVWVIPLGADDATWPDVFDGTTSAETATSRDILMASGRLGASVATDNTSSRTYPIPEFSVADLFGGRCPLKFVLFVTHSTGVNSHVTAGNHALYVKPVYETNA